MVGTLVRGCRCATSWCEIDWTFDFAVVTLTYKIMSGLYLVNWKLIFGRNIGWGGMYAFDLVRVTMSFKMLSGLFLGFHKV